MKILLATDGSAASLAAESMVSSLKLSKEIELKIVTVCPSADMQTFSSVPTAIQEMVDTCRRRSSELLEQAATRCRNWCHQVETHLADGHPAKELLQVAETWKADLIVMGARGLGAVGRFLMGSVSDAVAKQAPCSLLIVRADANAQNPRKIVVAYDGSAPAQAAVDRFSQLPHDPSRSIMLVGVIERINVYGVDVELTSAGSYQHFQDKLEPLMQQAVAKLKASTPNTSSVIRYAADAADELVESADKFGADLVVVGHRSKNVFERLVLGSVAIRLLHYAHSSVWIERPAPAAT
jgi:nucleotide-binding universal stress UspA family protein